MTRIDDLHKKWLKERPGYAKAVAELEGEFQLASQFIGARARAGLTQEQLAARMKTTRTVISRLESGRMKPSTRTLEKFAQATGHKLRITLEPAETRRPRRRVRRHAEARAELNKV
jgi:transcriptional regulator with XRE-family HTH domain